CLENMQSEAPVYLVMEPLDPHFKDDITRVNKMYPNAREKFNARYVGEIYHNADIVETQKILEQQDFNFHNTELSENKLFTHPQLLFTRMSDFTYNCVGYSQSNLNDFDALQLGQKFYLTSEQQAILDK